ncbi:hypothetical protein AM493_14395 [Flavobacterium akiainvivens]|uniref:Bacterial sugar transferase domain-containing protein n=1 Tax=Flavobacterium akiainvivens TaxID=1202724 RepID=A0A0M9VIX1_9FLAO|nr:exopolysaccharide biosynthesis polyprenyl glycosylphosphotransferase [Flavobacterium akiainvivens]KOS07092.1 hypothetical protein AM493_14395 [Flavobacterium akiainvivens]SFQ75566.1 putative colanic acid biosysnthesis UDP-glucose lipid carrier transferase [Flavobacterium akiainvivens]
MQAGKIVTYIKPLNVLLDIAAITLLGNYFFSSLVHNDVHFWCYQVIFWCAIAYFSKYYEAYRFTNALQHFYKVAIQLSLYLVAITGFFVFSRPAIYNVTAVTGYITMLLAVSAVLKISAYVLYCAMPVYHPENAIIVGDELLLPSGERSRLLKAFLPGAIPETTTQTVLAQAMAFAKSGNVQTIYCSMAQTTPSQAYALKQFSQKEGIALRFVPDNITSPLKSLTIDYFEAFPVFIAQKTPLHNPALKIFKRIFDIIFSSLVIIFVLSWLTPIIALIIKLETKGPVFFKQGRPGIDETEFICYKFRSMGVNRNSEAMAVKNDARVTKSGKFLRKTSLDELPQFFNVFLGDMSVVGPRPQLWYHNNEYKGHIHKFSDRLLVKPGITGLAQVSGYRGEINSDAEMQNRIRYDVFYIENWSILLDIRIIIQTVVNIFMGEEKAY